MKRIKPIFAKKFFHLVETLADNIERSRRDGLDSEVARVIGTNRSFVSLVRNGKRDFNLEHMVKLLVWSRKFFDSRLQDDEFRDLQEFWDIFGLALSMDEADDDLHTSRVFLAPYPDAGELAWKSTKKTIERPDLATHVLLSLLAPDVLTAEYQRTIIKLVAKPGMGKTTLLREIYKKAKPFFLGGILHGNFRNRTTNEILASWAHQLGIMSSYYSDDKHLAHNLNGQIKNSQLRWLIILEDWAPGDDCQILSLENAWVLMTSNSSVNLPETEDIEIPPFSDDEAISLFRMRMGAIWDAYNDPMRVKEINRRVAGTPLGLNILASTVAAFKSWSYVQNIAWGDDVYVNLDTLTKGPDRSLIDLLQKYFQSEFLSSSQSYMLKLSSFFYPDEPFLRQMLTLLKSGYFFPVVDLLQQLIEFGMLNELWDDHGQSLLVIHRLVAEGVKKDANKKQLRQLNYEMKDEIADYLPMLSPQLINYKDFVFQWRQVERAWLHFAKFSTGKSRDLENTTVDTPTTIQELYVYWGLFAIHSQQGPLVAIEFFKDAFHNNTSVNRESVWSVLIATRFAIECGETVGFLGYLSNLRKMIRREDFYEFEAFLLMAGTYFYYLKRDDPEQSLTKLVSYYHKNFSHMEFQQDDDGSLFAVAEYYRIVGKLQNFLAGDRVFSDDELEEHIQMLADSLKRYCPDRPLDERFEAVPVYLWIISVVEIVWEVIEMYCRHGFIYIAFDLAFLIHTITVSLPSFHFLDNLMYLIKLSHWTDRYDESEQMLLTLTEYEIRIFGENCKFRSQIAALDFAQDPIKATEALVRSLRRRGQAYWANRAESWSRWPVVQAPARSEEEQSLYYCPVMEVLEGWLYFVAKELVPPPWDESLLI